MRIILFLLCLFICGSVFGQTAKDSTIDPIINDYIIDSIIIVKKPNNSFLFISGSHSSGQTINKYEVILIESFFNDLDSSVKIRYIMDTGTLKKEFNNAKAMIKLQNDSSVIAPKNGCDLHRINGNDSFILTKKFFLVSETVSKIAWTNEPAPQYDGKYTEENKNENGYKVDSVERGDSGMIIVYKRGEIDASVSTTVTLNGTPRDTSFNTITYFSEIVTYSKNKFTDVERINSVKYIAKNKIPHPQPYSYNKDGLVLKGIYMPDDTLSYFVDADASHFTVPLKNTSVACNNIERIKGWDKYRLMKGAHFYFSASYMASYSRDIVITKTQDNSLTNMASYRRGNETGIYGQIVTADIGITIGVGSTLYGAALWSEQGIKTLGHTVDWSSGIAANDGSDHTYRFNSGGFGLGYTYSSYYNHPRSFYAVFDIAVYCQNLWNATDNWYIIGSENRDIWSAKMGLGLSFRPRYSIEYSLIPTIFWNFSNLDNSYLATKLFNIGITARIAFRPGSRTIRFE